MQDKEKSFYQQICNYVLRWCIFQQKEIQNKKMRNKGDEATMTHSEMIL